MFLALAVLLFQPSPVTALRNSVSTGAGMPANAIYNDKINETSAASGSTGTNVAVSPFVASGALANLPFQRSFSGGVMLLQSAPAAQANLPTALPAGAYLPGQLEPVAAGESSSRAESDPEAGAPASFRPTRYSPVSEAGRIHGLPRKWLLLSGIEHGAATFDAWQTRRVIENGFGYEMNPMLKPFANSNALYGAVQVAPLAFDYLSLRMLHSEHAWMRKLWWVPQSASAGASFFGGVHNAMMH